MSTTRDTLFPDTTASLSPQDILNAEGERVAEIEFAYRAGGMETRITIRFSPPKPPA